ncbi:MAG: hypothetical protein Kow0032_07690 [Methyloligellaceae bacterium]
MGEAKRRREAGEAIWRWKDVRREPPPENAYRLAVLAVITCECAKGGQVALTASRIDGQWVLDFNHSCEIEYWLRLPEFMPPRLQVN